MADQEKKVILTREGYEKLEKELDYYISVRRNEISEQIAIARGFGDLSENAEYDEAKNEQSRIEAKIVEMENTLRNCVVVEDDEVSTDVIGVGNTVKVQNLTMKIEQTITIVGANETDPKNMKISSESPIGAALLGKRKGEDGFVDLQKLTIEAKNRMPQHLRQKAVWYANADVLTALELQNSDAGQVQLHYGEFFDAKAVPVLHGRPVRQCDAIASDEASI